MSAVPQFLRAVTILEPQGNIAAEVAAHVKQTDRVAGRNLIAYFTGAGLVSGLLSYALIATELPGALALSAIGGTFDLYPGLAFGLALCGLFYAYLRVPLATLVIVLLMVQLSWQLAVFAAVRFGSDIEYGRQSAAINHALGATTSDTVVNSQFDVTNFFPGLVGGLVGAFGTWVAGAMATNRARSLEGAVLTTFAGGILGVLLTLKPMPWLLYMVWQSGVAASLAYQIARAR